MNKIIAKKDSNIRKCEKILNEINSGGNKNNLSEIEDIMRKDNSEQIFILTFLKLIETLNKENLEDQFDKYIHILSKDSINQNFPKFNHKKVSSVKLFSDIFDKILNLKNFDKSLEKVQFYNDLIYIDSKLDNIRGFTNYEKNKELSIYILVTQIKKGIAKHIKKIEDFTVNNDDILIKMQRQLIKDAEIFKKVGKLLTKNSGERPNKDDLNKYYLIKKSDNNYNADEFIEQCNENIILISKICSEDCKIYLENLKTFLSCIKINFDKRFPELENLKNKDFELLMDFCFFLEHHDFKSKSLNFYIKKWNNTFYQSRELIDSLLKKISYISNNYQYYLEKNDLIMKEYNRVLKTIDIKIIKDIDNYCINCILSDFTKYETMDEFQEIDTSKYSKSKSIINEYNIENYLKFDSTKEVYINKIWNFVKDYIIKIFSSKTVKSAFHKIFEELKVVDYYDFLDKNELEIILNRTRIFQFNTDILGLTEPSFLIDFIYYRGMIESYSENSSKLLNLCMYIVIQVHEILGHLNIRIQNYLSKDEITSPIWKVKDKLGRIISKPESGEFIENILYGRHINNLNYNEILFLLDVENYDVELEVFKTKFMAAKKDKYKISKSFSDLLKSLNITINDDIDFFNPLNINKDLIGKFYSDDDLYLYSLSKSHTDYFHPPKERNSLQYVLDYYYKNYSNNKINNKPMN